MAGAVTPGRVGPAVSGELLPAGVPGAGRPVAAGSRTYSFDTSDIGISVAIE